MIELLKSLYEQNELYHGEKERMAWQALAIYLTFSALYLHWLASGRSVPWCWSLLVSAIAFFPAFFLVRKQIYLKAVSVKKTGKLLSFMQSYPKPTKAQFSWLLQDLRHVEERRCWAQQRSMIFCEGWPQTWTLFSMSFFFVAQVAFILSSIPWIRCALIRFFSLTFLR